MGSGDQLPVSLFLVGIGVAAAWVLAFCLATRYRISDREIEVRRFGLTLVRIPLSSIVRARLMTWGDMLELSVTRERRLMRNRRWLTSYFRRLLVLETQQGRIYALSPGPEQIEQLRAGLKLG